jgi:hypothetical protein
MIMKLWNLLQGKKTYLAALATLLYAGLGIYLHFMTYTMAMPYVLSALGAIGFRSAMKK